MDSVAAYYRQHFDAGLLLRFLGLCGAGNTREWAFWVNATRGEGTFMMRHFAVTNPRDVWAMLSARAVRRIEVSAVFARPMICTPAEFLAERAVPAPPAEREQRSNNRKRKCDEQRSNTPVRRELVFDIDMDDYDVEGLRGCDCRGSKTICPKCWALLVVGARLLDATLCHVFGFRNTCWVFSGRRGLHCWVCDPAIYEIGNEARAAIAMHASSVFDSGCNWPDDFADVVEREIRAHGPRICTMHGQAVPEGTRKTARLLRARLDAKVTGEMGHLIKLPLCLHPDTQRACLPVDVWAAETMDAASMDDLFPPVGHATFDAKAKEGRRRLDFFIKSYQG